MKAYSFAATETLPGVASFSLKVRLSSGSAVVADFVAFFHGMVGVGCGPLFAAQAGGVNDRRAAEPRLEFARPADEVGVHVGLEDVGDVEAVVGREADELVDVAGRVDDRRFAGGLIANQM